MEDICIICFQNTQNLVIGKSCQCKYCYCCLFDWLEENPQMLSPSYFNCLNYECNKLIAVEDIIKQINEQKILARYHDITFKYYLKNQQDIRICPNRNCNSCGYLPSSRCSDLLQCEICNYKWYDKKCLSINKIISLFMKNMKNNFLCFFQEFYYAHQCPNCDVQIIKNGGCNHMTCKSCNHEYCFICRDKHHGHDAKLCALKENTFHILIAYIIIQLLFTFGFHTMLLFISKYIYQLLCVILVFIWDINGKLILIGALCILFDAKYQFQQYKKESLKLYVNVNNKKKKLHYLLELIFLFLIEILVILTTIQEENINKFHSLAIYIIYPCEFLTMLFVSLRNK